MGIYLFYHFNVLLRKLKLNVQVVFVAYISVVWHKRIKYSSCVCYLDIKMYRHSIVSFSHLYCISINISTMLHRMKRNRKYGQFHSDSTGKLFIIGSCCVLLWKLPRHKISKFWMIWNHDVSMSSLRQLMNLRVHWNWKEWIKTSFYNLCSVISCLGTCCLG